MRHCNKGNAAHLAGLMAKNWCHCRGKTWCVFHAVPIRTHLKQARYWTLQWLNKLLCIDCVIMKINSEFRLCMKGPGRIGSWSRVHFYTSKYSLSLYFADFYCMAIHCRYERYRVTLVICQKGTVLLPCHVRRLEWLINPEKYKGSPYSVAWERCIFFFIYFFIIIYMVWTLINWYFYSYRLLRITSLRTYGLAGRLVTCRYSDLRPHHITPVTISMKGLSTNAAYSLHMVEDTKKKW